MKRNEFADQIDAFAESILRSTEKYMHKVSKEDREFFAMINALLYTYTLTLGEDARAYEAHSWEEFFKVARNLNPGLDLNPSEN